MRRTGPVVTLCLACSWVAACKLDSVQPDVVGPQVGAPAGASGSVTGPITGTAGASAGAGSGVAGVSGASGVGGAGLGGAGLGSAGLGGMAGANADAGAGVAGAAGMSTGTGNDGPCDLGGRWLVTVHAVTEAIGQQQTTHAFIYYEIARQGDGLAITKGLHCGDDAVAGGALAVTVNLKPSWQAVMSKVSYLGRSVSSAESAGGCDVHFGKWYTVRGATLPYYADPAHPLPTADQPASADGTTPGWEDWDGDGNPGVTGRLTGSVIGSIFVAPRHWTELAGTVPSIAERFRLPLTWDQEPNVMAYDPPDNILLGSTSDRAGDPSLHFAELARLSPDQATGDDLAICNAVVELASTLTPAAAAL